MAVEDFPAPQTRKSRIVCISDTHNSSPKDGGWKLPKGDILIHAGDLTNQGTFSELQKTIKWIEEADFEVKVVIAGISNPLLRHLNLPAPKRSQETTILLSISVSMPRIGRIFTIKMLKMP